MDEAIMHEILQDLFSSLEALETQSRAISQFLKDKGIVKEEELAPYLEQAGNASSVRWLAARVRIDYLLSGAMKAAEEEAKENRRRLRRPARKRMEPRKILRKKKPGGTLTARSRLEQAAKLRWMLPGPR